jgi:hypothetical protein
LGERYARFVGKKTDVRLMQWRSASKFDIRDQNLANTLFVVTLGPGAEANWMNRLFNETKPQKYLPFISQFRMMDPRIYAQAKLYVQSHVSKTKNLAPDHLLLDSIPNLGPLISRWEINKFEVC